MNCRTQEHRHFERTLRTEDHFLCPCLAQGRLNIHQLILTALGSRGVKPAWLQGVAVSATACTDPLVLRPGSLLATAVSATGPLGGNLPGDRLQLNSRPEIRQGYPPNLSILISGGKENNSDTLSNGE